MRVAKTLLSLLLILSLGLVFSGCSSQEEVGEEVIKDAQNLGPRLPGVERGKSPAGTPPPR